MPVGQTMDGRAGRIRRRSAAAVWLGAAAALLTLGGCGGPDGAPGRERVPLVTVVKVEPMTVPLDYTLLGQTDDSGRVEIRSRVAGYLLEKHFHDGDIVDEGDPLYTIDPAEYKAAVEETEAQVALAEAEMRLAEADLARARLLVQSNTVSERDVEVAVAKETSGRANVRLAKARRETARLQLSYTTITAPLTGLVGKSDKNPGAYVDPGANSYLNEVIATNPIKVTMTMAERDGLQWQNDIDTSRVLIQTEDGRMRVAVDLIDGTRYPYEGHLTFRDIRVDPQTGTVRLEALLDNPGHRLTPGLFVKVHLLGPVRPNALVVPQRSVQQTGTGPTVLVINDQGVARVQPVVLGPWHRHGWVVESGLSPGDNVVVAGMAQVQASKPAKIVKTVTFDEVLKIGPDSGSAPASEPASTEQAG